MPLELPKARVLAVSLACVEPQASLTLCLNDVHPDWLDPATEPFDRIWLPEDLGYDRGWIFQHNVMELCTAVKGRAPGPKTSPAGSAHPPGS